MRYTLGTAAKATGVSKIFHPAGNPKGRLSYVEKDSTGYRIKASELFRVFPFVTLAPVPIEQTARDAAALQPINGFF